MKRIIVLICLLISIPANAEIRRITSGVTYCVSEYGGNFIIDWKNNAVTLNLAGSDTYKIIKETKDSNNSGMILTARKNFYQDEYVEFKLFSNASGDFLRTWNKDTKQYYYHPARLSCWSEE